MFLCIFVHKFFKKKCYVHTNTTGTGVLLLQCEVLSLHSKRGRKSVVLLQNGVQSRYPQIVRPSIFNSFIQSHGAGATIPERCPDFPGPSRLLQILRQVTKMSSDWLRSVVPQGCPGSPSRPPSGVTYLELLSREASRRHLEPPQLLQRLTLSFRVTEPLYKGNSFRRLDLPSCSLGHQPKVVIIVQGDNVDRGLSKVFHLWA